MQAGLTLSHYRMLRKLGAGGMGEVWLAEDTRLARNVAVKILPPEMAADRDRLERFLQEARAASALSHPNAAYIYEIGEQAGLHFLVMEYIEGQTLEARLSEAAGPLGLAEMVSIGSQVAEALDAAHARGIVHRDIKPANIMIAARGHVKVLDFGLAKIVPQPRASSSDVDTRLLTSDGVVLGTVQYMSPEQALGRGVDARSDVFSLGAVLYQMATARLPFAGSSAQETLARILNSAPDALARFNYDVPEAFERLVRKCLEKDRERRYQSARELAVDLRGLERERTPTPAASQTIRAVIVDDEELARIVLREYLSKVPGVEVVAECGNGFEAVKAVAEHKPSLVFLDVQMPKLDGFEVLELIDPGVAVIFVTAYDQYAMRAFDAHAVDYLLKPFSAGRLEKALDRARGRLGGKRPPAAELAAAARAPESYLERVVVRDGAKVHIIPIAKLDYVEAQDDYIALHSEKKNYLKQQTISSIEGALDPKRFIRIHRSYIVNVERIARIEPYTKDSRVAVLQDGSQLPVSRAGHAKLKALLEEG